MLQLQALRWVSLSLTTLLVVWFTGMGFWWLLGGFVAFTVLNFRSDIVLAWGRTFPRIKSALRRSGRRISIATVRAMRHLAAFARLVYRKVRILVRRLVRRLIIAYGRSRPHIVAFARYAASRIRGLVAYLIPRTGRFIVWVYEATLDLLGYILPRVWRFVTTHPVGVWATGSIVGLIASVWFNWTLNTKLWMLGSTILSIISFFKRWGKVRSLLFEKGAGSLGLWAFLLFTFVACKMVYKKGGYFLTTLDSSLLYTAFGMMVAAIILGMGRLGR